MYNSQYYTCEQIDERLLQGYLDDYNSQTGQSLTKAQFLTALYNAISVASGISTELENLGKDINLLTNIIATEVSGDSLITPSAYKKGKIYKVDLGDQGPNFSAFVRCYQYYIAKVDGAAGDSLDNTSKFETTYSSAEALNKVIGYIKTDSDNTHTQVGYYECDTAGATAAKTIAVANYSLFVGGSLKVKFANKNTADNATLNINSQGAKDLYYQGERASATNSWDANEVVEIYYDGTSYYANNVNGGSGSGVYDVSKEHPTSGPNSDGKFTLEYILNSNNVDELIPVNKRYPGMSIQFVSTSDNKYVQYFCNSNTFTTAESAWEKMNLAHTLMGVVYGTYNYNTSYKYLKVSDFGLAVGDVIKASVIDHSGISGMYVRIGFSNGSGNNPHNLAYFGNINEQENVKTITIKDTWFYIDSPSAPNATIKFYNTGLDSAVANNTENINALKTSVNDLNDLVYDYTYGTLNMTSAASQYKAISNYGLSVNDKVSVSVKNAAGTTTQLIRIGFANGSGNDPHDLTGFANVSDTEKIKEITIKDTWLYFDATSALNATITFFKKGLETLVPENTADIKQLKTDVSQIQGEIDIPVIKTLKTDGSGDFTSLKVAMEYAAANPLSTGHYQFNIYEGTYNVCSDFTDEEINSADYDHGGFVGVEIPNNVVLIGIGVKENIVLHGEISETYGSDKRGSISTLNPKGNCRLENLTISSRNIRYPIHPDFSTMVNKKQEYINCDFINYKNASNTYNFQYAFGSGLWSGLEIIIDGCNMTPSLTCHSSLNFTKSATIWIKNSYIENNVVLSDAESLVDCYCHLVNTKYGTLNLGHDGSITTEKYHINGINNSHGIIICTPPRKYMLDETTYKHFPSICQKGRCVALTDTKNCVASNIAFFGITLEGSTTVNEKLKVQTSGYVPANIIYESSKYSGWSAGDYLKPNSNDYTLEVTQNKIDAVAVVAYVGSSGTPYIKIL